MLPAHDEQGAANVLVNLEQLVAINNQFYPGVPLSLATGAATRGTDESLEDTIKRADGLMYRAKNDYYSKSAQDLRAAQAEFESWRNAV